MNVVLTAKLQYYLSGSLLAHYEPVDDDTSNLAEDLVGRYPT